MEPEEATTTCENCKREIPCSNLTMHELHCARNISTCPTCKEPVPRPLMQEHQDKYHKLVPCKQCGESVCGTDLEDHIRDSCANTIQSCRYCELELPRHSTPAHESYCGARTEQCAECGEYVMIKYRSLHRDSNHGFLRLDDDPVPRKEKSIKPPTAKPSSSKTKGQKTIKPNEEAQTNESPSTSHNNIGPSTSGNRAQTATNGAVAKTNKTGVKSKSRAPPPPLEQRDLPYYSALQRAQHDERQRRELNQHNLAMGLPPVLNAAEKLEKLRKIDALANRETEPTDYGNILRGRVWMSPDIPAGQVLGNSPMSQDQNSTKRETKESDRPMRNANQNPGSSSIQQNQEPTESNQPSKVRNSKKTVNLPPEDDQDYQSRRQEFQNLQPMTPEEFADRFNELQIRNCTAAINVGDRVNESGDRRNDRFSEIKSSLRELRRGLNAVTAPYNLNNVGAANNNGNINFQINEPGGPDLLPCEFCTELIELDDLVMHQTGCRPDLAQFRAVSPFPVPPPSYSPPPMNPTPLPHVHPLDSPPRSYEGPVIPCEFCMESLPVYLITEHQERCGREANLLYPD